MAGSEGRLAGVARGLTAGAVGAILLGALEVAWHYVANHAEVVEPTRATWKAALLWAAVAPAALVPAAAAVRAGDGWWRAAALAGALSVVGGGVVAWLAGGAVGDRHGGNSVLLGEPALVRIGVGLIGLVLLALLAAAFGTVVGWGARLVVRRLVEDGRPGG